MPSPYQKNQLHIQRPPRELFSLQLVFWSHGKLQRHCIHPSPDQLTSSMVVPTFLERWKGEVFNFRLLKSEYSAGFALSHCFLRHKGAAQFVYTHVWPKLICQCKSLPCVCSEGEQYSDVRTLPYNRKASPTTFQVCSQHPNEFDPHCKYSHSTSEGKYQEYRGRHVLGSGEGPQLAAPVIIPPKSSFFYCFFVERCWNEMPPWTCKALQDATIHPLEKEDSTALHMARGTSAAEGAPRATSQRFTHNQLPESVRPSPSGTASDPTYSQVPVAWQEVR